MASTQCTLNTKPALNLARPQTATFPVAWWVQPAQPQPQPQAVNNGESTTPAAESLGRDDPTWTPHPGLTSILETTSTTTTATLGTPTDPDCPICKGSLSSPSALYECPFPPTQRWRRAKYWLTTVDGVARHESCGRMMHRACLASWVGTFVGGEGSRGEGDVINCPMCRGHIGKAVHWRGECGRVHLGRCTDDGCQSRGEARDPASLDWRDENAWIERWWNGPSGGFAAARKREEEWREACAVQYPLTLQCLSILTAIMRGHESSCERERLRRLVRFHEDEVEFFRAGNWAVESRVVRRRGEILQCIKKEIEQCIREADAWVDLRKERPANVREICEREGWFRLSLAD